MTTTETTPERVDRPSGHGQHLIKDWIRSQQCFQRAQSAAQRCKGELEESEARLAKWILPDDARNREVFAIWFGDSLISASRMSCGVLGSNDKYKVTVRQQGKSILEI